MPRAKNKEALLADAAFKYQALINLIESMSYELQTAAFSFEDRDKNIRDVLIHLHEWQNMMKIWYQVGVIENKVPVIPKVGYTFKTTPALNYEIWQSYQQTSLEEAKQYLSATHQEMMIIIKKHTDEELFTQGIYPWTKTTTLGSYLVSATASHYEWAIKKIKKHQKLSI